MGKRSSFERRPMDDYQTIDGRAVSALAPHLFGIRTFAEPCAGEGNLVVMLEEIGLRCTFKSDLRDGVDALKVNYFGTVDAIITNPPWTRELLHPMLLHFQKIAPTWLLFDADWPHTKQSAPYIDQCSHIVSVGRLRWIPDTKQTGKDNCAWYRFHAQHVGGPKFIGPMLKVAA